MMKKNESNTTSTNWFYPENSTDNNFNDGFAGHEHLTAAFIKQMHWFRGVKSLISKCIEFLFFFFVVVDAVVVAAAAAAATPHNFFSFCRGY